MKVIKTERKDTSNGTDYYVTIGFGSVDANVLTAKRDGFIDRDEMRQKVLDLVTKALDALV